MDTLGRAAIESWVHRAAPTHPTLIDHAHVLGELFGVVNVPGAVWIDESGTIVRPAHTPSLGRSRITQPTADMPENIRHMLELAHRIRLTDPDYYRAALWDWIERGAASDYALDADEVVARSDARPREQAEAAAYFEIAQWLQRHDRGAEAIEWFRRAHELHPDNWTYRRQAWSIVDPSQNAEETYGTTWAEALERRGPEHYYVPFEES